MPEQPPCNVPTPVWRWSISVLDWHYHAIDVAHDHPTGCYKAACAHLLMMVVELCSQPYGRQCAECVSKIN